MVRLLGGLIVEYSEYDLRTCELLDRYCVLDPDGCCSFSPPCLPSPIPTNLYWSPNPTTLMEINHSAPFTAGKWYSLITAVEKCFGVGSFDTIFPMPISYDEVTNRFYGVVSYGLGPGTGGDPATWTHPSLYVRLNQRLCDFEGDPEDPSNWFGTDTDTICIYRCSAAEDITNGKPLGFYSHRRSLHGNASLPYGNVLSYTGVCTAGGTNCGFNQYGSTNAYLEWNRTFTPGNPASLTTAGTQVFYCERFTSHRPGHEIPPLRDGICGSHHPPQIDAFIEYSTTGATWSTVGIYRLTWRHGCYYKDVPQVVGGPLNGLRLVLTLYISVAKQNLSGDICPHKMIAMTCLRSSVSTDCTNGTPIIWWNWLTTANCNPYTVNATQLFPDRVIGSSERLRVTLVEV